MHNNDFTDVIRNMFSDAKEGKNVNKTLISTGHGRNNYEGWNFNNGNYLFTTDTKQIQVSKFYCLSL